MLILIKGKSVQFRLTCVAQKWFGYVIAVHGHMIRHGLDWISKTWTGLIKHGLIKHGLMKDTLQDTKTCQ